MTTPTPEKPEVTKENDKEHNFEQLRRKLEASEREKQQALAKAAEYEKQAQEASKKKTRDPEPDDDDHYDEPYVDERRLNKKLSRFEERFDKKVDEKAEAKAAAMIQQERNSNFLKQNPDFHQILSQEVIEKFAQKHPEVAEPMLEMPEGFARQKLLYQAIKLSGVHQPAKPPPSIQETIDKNRRSPFYQPSGMGAAPYANGGDFSDTGQKSAYDHVQALKKRLRI